MRKLVIAAFAAVIATSAASTLAREIQLNDQDRQELRNRADSYQRSGRNDRTMSIRQSTHRMADRTRAKAHKAKHKVKHKAHKAKRRTQQRMG